MTELQLKGFLYVLVESCSGLPVFGTGSDRIDSCVSVFVNEMQEKSTDVVYDNENPQFNAQLKIKVNGGVSSCSLECMNASPKKGESDILGQVVVDLSKIVAGESQEFPFDEPWKLRPENATGDPAKDKVQGRVKFSVMYKAYKKKATPEEEAAEAARLKAERDAAAAKQLELERQELAARLAAERAAQEKAEAERAAQARAIQEANARKLAEEQAAAAAAAAALERAQREAAAKAELEARAKKEAEHEAQVRAAELAARQAFEARQKMLLEEQKASADAAAAAAAQKQLEAMKEDVIEDAATVGGDNMLTPARGAPTTNWVSRQVAPATRLTGTVSNVSGGKDGYLYCANSTDKIYCLAPGGAWTQIPGRAICLAAADDGTVWCVNRQQRIYALQADRTTWIQQPGAMQWIAIGSKDQIWGVDITGKPSKFDTAKNAWVAQPGTGLTKVSVGSDGEVWGISDDHRPMRFANGRWTRLPGSVKEIAVQDSHCIWATHILGGLFVWHGNHWEKLAGGEPYHGATVTRYGAWAFDSTGKPFFSAPPADDFLSGSAVSTTMGSNGSFEPKLAIDGNRNSFWWSGKPPAPGDTFTVMFNPPLLRASINVLSGKPASIGGVGDGKIESARLEITFDKQNWITIGSFQNGECAASLPAVALHGARVFITKPQTTHVAIREFELHGVPSKITDGCKITTTMGHHGDYTVEKAIDSDIGSFFWSGAPAKRGDNILIQFTTPVVKNGVHIVTGHTDGLRDWIWAGSFRYTHDTNVSNEAAWSAKEKFSKSGSFTFPAKPLTAVKIEIEDAHPQQWIAIRELMFY